MVDQILMKNILIQSISSFNNRIFLQSISSKDSTELLPSCDSLTTCAFFDLHICTTLNDSGNQCWITPYEMPGGEWFNLNIKEKFQKTQDLFDLIRDEILTRF